MKQLIILLCLLFSSFFIPSLAFAQTTPTPTPSNQESFTTTDEANTTVTTLKNFISNIDSLLGGFIFYTPDVFGDTITLQDGSVLNGLGNFRNIFYAISIPLIAIGTAVFAMQKLSDERPYVFKSFLFRLFLVATLFIITPTLLSYTIQGNNLLIKQIQQDTHFTTFLNNYLDNTNEQINSGEDPQKFGIPNTQISIVGGYINSFWKFLFQAVLFFIILIFLVIGLLFIVFQSIIRFATLLFLSVLFPLAIPFMLSEKTEGITNTYFKTWFSFLIHQPAFVLGYAIAGAILESILSKNGASIGLLFLYTGFLFFLGGVNVLIARIFSESWSALGANIAGAVLSGAVGGSGGKTFGLFKQGMVGGSVNGVRSLAGRSFARKAGFLTMDGRNFGIPKASPLSAESTSTSGRRGKIVSEEGSRSSEDTSSVPNIPSYTRELEKKGLKTDIVDPKQGTVRISGEGYKYTDQSAGLTTIYPTKTDGVNDGIKAAELKKVNLNEAKYIDLSSFTKNKPNPHNIVATSEAKRLGHKADYAHLTPASDPIRVKNFLTLSEKAHSKEGIQGVIIKRYGNNAGVRSSNRIIRLYTKKL